MKLSLCIVTYNEEANIHYPLDSAYDLVDEVIIVDGGSTDKTVEKAKAYGKKVKVFSENYVAMFHVNKQKALDKAKGEWILQLDADEALSKELKEEIKNIVGTIHELSLPVAYNIPRKNFFLTRFLTKGGQYPDYTIRLYRNGSVRFPCRSVHENVELIPTSEVENKLENGKTSEVVSHLKNPILHYADPTFSRYLQRWDRYTSLDANILVGNGRDRSLHFVDYFFIKPTFWFLNTYFRHKGFMDGFPGFVFCLFSSIRFWVIYVKWWQKKQV